MGVIKVSSNKIYLQGHLRALAMVPFDTPHMISCKSSIATRPMHIYVSILHHFRDTVAYFPKFKEVT